MSSIPFALSPLTIKPLSELKVEPPEPTSWRKHAAFRRARIDVGEVREVGGVLQFAECRKAVELFAAIVGERWSKARSRQRADTKTEHVPARELRHARDILQDRFPFRAALSASNHHSAGKPDWPYFGNSDGRPKRSQRAVRTLG